MDQLLAETGKLFSQQNPDGSWSFVGNWFTYANFTLATGVFGFTFLIACIITATYYVLVVVTDPTQVEGKRSSRMSYNNGPTLLQEWNFERVLRLIYFAYMTYSTLDLEDLTCQSKIICELQESDGVVGKATRQISDFLLFFSVFNKVPYIAQYRLAARHGQRRTDNGTRVDEHDPCHKFYSSCKFSVHQFNDHYNSVFGNGNEMIVSNPERLRTTTLPIS